MTPLKNNIAASYVAQVYVTLIGIAMVPLYLRFMGAEAYGLIGFYTMLQAWFMLLDMGLTPTLAREAARTNGNAAAMPGLRSLLRVLEVLFAGCGVLGRSGIPSAGKRRTKGLCQWWPFGGTPLNRPCCRWPPL